MPTAAARKGRHHRVVPVFLLAAISVLLVVLAQQPGPAWASIKRGTMEIALESTVSMDAGKSVALNCAVTPSSERQRPCCSTDYCPSGCESGGIKGCLDREGFCTCLGGDYYTANAKCSVTSSSPSIARAKWSDGVLTVKGYKQGTATITVTAKMSLWVSTTRQLQVDVRAASGGEGESGGSGDEKGSSGSDGGASSGATSSKDTGSSAGAGASSSSKGSSAAAPKGGNSKSSAKGGNTKGTSKTSSKSGNSKSTSKSKAGSGGVTAKSAKVSGGASDTSQVHRRVTSVHADTEEEDRPRDEEKADDAVQPDDQGAPVVEQADAAELDSSKAANAVSVVENQGTSPLASPVAWGVVAVLAVLAALGSFARYRMWQRQRAPFVAAVVDEDDEEDR